MVLENLFAGPSEWGLWEYVAWGGIFAVGMLVGGYFIGILWQRWRDGRRA